MLFVNCVQITVTSGVVRERVRVTWCFQRGPVDRWCRLGAVARKEAGAKREFQFGSLGTEKVISYFRYSLQSRTGLGSRTNPRGGFLKRTKSGETPSAKKRILNRVSSAPKSLPFETKKALQSKNPNAQSLDKRVCMCKQIEGSAT